MFGYQLSLAVAFALLPAQWTVYTDEFSRRLNSIMAKTSLTAHERAVGYRLLTEQCPNHPRLAEAYLAWATNIDSDGTELFQKAVAASVPGTDLWKRAQLALASSYAKDSPKTSARLIDEVVERFPDIETRAWREMFHLYQHLEKQDFERAETHLAAMIEMNSHRYEHTLSLDQKFRLNQNVGSSVSSYFGRISLLDDWSPNKRLAKLREFARKHPSRHADIALKVAEETVRARQEFFRQVAEKHKAAVLASINRSDDLPPSEPGIGKAFWISLGTVGTLVAGYFILRFVRRAQASGA